MIPYTVRRRLSVMLRELSIEYPYIFSSSCTTCLLIVSQTTLFLAWLVVNGAIAAPLATCYAVAPLTIS